MLSDSRPRRLEGAAWAAALLLSVLPFLFVDVPPLADAPGHLAQLAVQTAPADSPLWRYFGFSWALKLNLGTDLLVQVLHPLLGLQRAFWLVTALIPPLTVVGIYSLGRAAHPDGGGAGASFALAFAYAYPFNFGFLNYALAMALAFLAFALWIRLESQSRRRELLFWAITPLLLVCHAIGGGLLLVMIAARAAASHPVLSRAFVREVRPLTAAVPLLILWKTAAPQGEFQIVYGLLPKLNAVLHALRDQDRLLDIASTVLIIAAPLVGGLLGARYSRANGAVVAALALVLLLLPNEFNGSSYADTRIAPAFAIAALTLQDWTRVRLKFARAVVAAGFLLFAARMAVTTAGFAAYARNYAAERSALAHVEPGSRVLSLVTRQCRASRAWRMHRLDHLAALAVVDRQSWTNALWDVPGIHLLTVGYRPSPDFYNDPSHYVWPEECVRGEPVPYTVEEYRNRRRTIAEAAPMLPLDRIDYLWLIQAQLPVGFAADRLAPVWSNGPSTLYRVTRPAAPTPR